MCTRQWLTLFCSLLLLLLAWHQAIINVMRACVGLAPENHMLLEHRMASEIDAREAVSAAVFCIRLRWRWRRCGGGGGGGGGAVAVAAVVLFLLLVGEGVVAGFVVFVGG